MPIPKSRNTAAPISVASTIPTKNAPTVQPRTMPTPFPTDPGLGGIPLNTRHLHPLAAERPQHRLFQAVAIEHVVGIEGNQALPVGMGDVDAGLLDRAYVEGVSVDELHDDHAENILISEASRHVNLGKAAEQLA